jgi:hypothetical protein
MKNILAENMLRFGVKNLSESDITKIEETLSEAPNAGFQPYADVNPNSWKWKDQASFENLSITSYPVTLPDAKKAAADVYGTWCTERRSTSIGAANIALRGDVKERTQELAWCLSEIMHAQGQYDATLPMYKNFKNVLNASMTVSQRLKRIKGGDAAVPLMMIGNPTYDITSDRMTQQQWEATLGLIAPAINAVIAKYIIKPVAATPTTPKPATPGMQPGTAKAPGKP